MVTANLSAAMTDPSYTYAFAGVAIASALALPELPAAPEGAQPRYRIEVSGEPLLPTAGVDASHDWLDAAGAVTMTGLRCGDVHYLHLPGLADARFGVDGCVTIHRNPEVSLASLHHALVDQILPRLLAGAGALMTHAAAVVDPGARAILLLGDSGYGKSTLCAALVRGGARLLSDDCVLLQTAGSEVTVIPGYPGMRLRPDSLSALYAGQLPATTPVADHMDKRRVALLAPEDPASNTVKLAPSAQVGAIVLLQPPGADVTVTLERMAPARACMALVHNSFALDPTDKQRVRAQLAKASAVIQAVPAYTLGYPRDYARLPDVLDRLREISLAARP